MDLEVNHCSNPTLKNPPDAALYFMRAGFVTELCAMSENSKLKGNSPLRTKYPDLFLSASNLKGMRNILAHRYGLPGPGIDGERVWEVFHSELESDILPKLKEVIVKEEEEAEQEKEEEEKAEEAEGEEDE